MRVAAVALLLLLLPPAAGAGSRWAISAVAEVTADGRARLPVTVSGPPRRQSVEGEAPPPLTVSAGTIDGPPRRIAPGVYEYIWAVPRLAAPARAQLTLGPARRPWAHASVRLVPEPPRISRQRPEGPAGFDVPDRIILSSNGTPLLRLTRWPREPPPRVRVSAGEVGPARRAADGAWELDYRPPRERFPRVLLVAALGANDELVDWVRVPLVGAGTIETRTDPDSWVRVRLDAEEYGPVRTDRRGRAALGILAPPGLRVAETLAVDALGNVSRRKLELGIPSAPSALVLCPLGQERLTLLALGAGGLPLSGEKVLVKGRGLVTAPAAELQPGIWVGPLVRLDKRSGQQLVVTVVVSGRPVAECRWVPPPPLPTRLELTSTPARHQAGAGEILLHLTALDERGPLSTAVELRTDFGQVVRIEEKAPGRYIAALAVANAFEGRQELRLRAQVRGRAPIAELTLPLEPGPLSRLELRAAEGALQADGETGTTVVAVATDAWGNPISTRLPVLRAEGTLEKVASTEGTGHFLYVPPERFAPSEDALVASVPGTALRSELRLQLSPTAPRWSAGARVGGLGGLGRASPMGSVDGHFRPTARLRRHFSFGLEAGYVSDAQERLDASERTQVRTRVWLAPTLVRASYTPVFSPVRLYGGIGVGALWFGWAAESELTGRAGGTGVALAAAPHLGAERRVGPGAIAVEGALLLARPPDAAFGSGLLGFTLTGGYRLER